MVDAVVSFVVERVGDYLIREAAFLGQVKNEVSWLKKELEWMLCFVKDAEQKQVGNDLIRQWLLDIRDIAYDAEYVLDKYVIEINDGGTSYSPIVDGEGTSIGRQGSLSFIAKCSCFCGNEESSSDKKSSLYSKAKEKISLYNIGKEIEALKDRLNDISRRRQLYSLEDITNKRQVENPALDKLKQLRRTASFAVEENVVGFKNDASKLLSKLFDKEPRRMVISIYGMGGLGKTTLAQKLYHHIDVKNKFHYCAWVSVSQDFKLQDLLLRIIKSFGFQRNAENLEKMTEEDLERHLHKSLQGHSYLMVVDDLWHKEDWESLKRAFPDNKNGSRVIVTTRIREVISQSDEKTYVHELPFLNPDESWQLFCNKAFGNINGDHRGLENLGRELVEKCGGLPLAIVVLGGLLSSKKPQEWRMVRDHIWPHLRSDSIHISYLLDLSFNDLPRQLKLCFLYLSVFPEDYEIDVERLIRLLVAEGFISQNGNQIMEDVAKENLNELNNRSLIQKGRISWGRVATCRVHDLLRDLAIRKAKELNFIHICDEFKNPTPSSVISSCRRQGVHSQNQSCLWLQHANSLSRSLLLFNTESREDVCVRLFKRFSLLRLLDFERFACESLDKEIGKLIHLKYLRLTKPSIFKLPPFMVKLQRLETLDLSGGPDWPIELPSEISQLHELRHLLGHFVGTLLIESLTNLQTLKYVDFESWSKVNTDKLINVRELGITERHSKGDKLFTFESISKLKNLQFFYVEMRHNNFLPSLQPLSPCSCLVDLRLIGKMRNLPRDMHELLPSLECLKLQIERYFGEDPMPVLEKLPNLTILDLNFESNYVKKLICTAEGFPRLEILRLIARGLDEWQVEEGAMPMLRGLTTSRLSKSKIPERLRSMPPPAKLEFYIDESFETNPSIAIYDVMNMSYAYAWRLRDNVMDFRVEDSRKIEINPSASPMGLHY